MIKSRLKSRTFILFLLSAFIHQTVLADNNGSINSATITAATVKALPNCQHFRPLGFCMWFSPIPWIGVNYTPLIEEYMPDLVVSVFNQAGENPWEEINATLDQVGKAAEQDIVTTVSGDHAGSGQHSFGDIHQQNAFFKEADVIGNPGLIALPQQLLLPSAAIPMAPYYQSMLDAAMWRGFPNVPGVLEEEGFAMVADLTHYIGSGLINWGGLYPHEGKIATTNDAKAAAVIAQRASDLTTSKVFFNHLHQPLSNRCGRHCEAALIQENSNKTQFQMLYPLENDSCDYFGKTLNYGEEAETQTHGAYAWILWRYYRGCRDGIGAFVQEIPF